MHSLFLTEKKSLPRRKRSLSRSLSLSHTFIDSLEKNEDRGGKERGAPYVNGTQHGNGIAAIFYFIFFSLA